MAQNTFKKMLKQHPGETEDQLKYKFFSQMVPQMDKDLWGHSRLWSICPPMGSTCFPAYLNTDDNQQII